MKLHLRATYRVSLATWDHTLLPATQHKWTHHALIPARGRYSIYLPIRDGRLSWPGWNMFVKPVKYFVCLQILHRICFTNLTVAS